MHTLTLTGAPSLGPLLARGALLSPCKSLRPPRLTAPSGPRLVLPGVRIDLARLAAYERVCGFPTGEDAVPVTYPHVLGFPLAMRIMAARDFPLPLLGLVHTSIEITRRRQLAATGEYELTVYVDELAPHRRGTEATVVTEVRDGGGVAWESRSTYLARHRTDGTQAVDARSDGARSDGARSDGARSDGARSDGARSDGARSGGTRGGGTRGGGGERSRAERKPLPPVAEWRLGEDVGRRYGTVSGDRNPIHLHPLAARLFGFPRAIAHGMWTVARCLAEHGTPAAVLVRAEFRAPVPLPSTVTYGEDGTVGGGFELRGGPPGGQRVHVTGHVHPLAL
ncbi:hypothetical protein SGFS_070200 [Streptomyces graminofaciens]|uniref:MaoC-like domain-containing protein n=1 Tax=Streptomyces graminofaciens TaxID=68212 RepID=A0ABN5VQK3_9ACTN|nr:MaoC/PaaZ C-terminal domain-containing protein [Streptomyces graminofaciens]BBC35726.1 hypothetical protein SGFS_070200 [Streptomyces graminofaciens]